MHRFLFLAALTLSVGSAQSLFIINADFGNIPVQCAAGHAYQSSEGGNCSDQFPQQAFNITPGMGWKMTPHTETVLGSGLTDPNTGFNPPPFNGLPFIRAASLQGPSTVLQPIHGFVPGVAYALSFYLGSRYGNGCCDGNQTVQARIDGRVIGSWSLVSFTPFTIRRAFFSVATGGTHTLEIVGLNPGDHTAFFSGVHIVVAADASH